MRRNIAQKKVERKRKLVNRKRRIQYRLRDISYKGDWSCHPLVVSLANTGEPLHLVNRSGSRPSHEGAAWYLDRAGALCERAGFKGILYRGDTDFTQTKHLDRYIQCQQGDPRCVVDY